MFQKLKETKLNSRKKMIVLTCARRAVASRQGGLRLMNTHAHGGGGSGLRNGIMGAAIFSFVGGVYWYTIGKMQQVRTAD